jgi:hypothetical protein
LGQERKKVLRWELIILLCKLDSRWTLRRAADLTTWFAFEGMMACFGAVGDEVSLAGEIFGA